MIKRHFANELLRREGVTLGAKGANGEVRQVTQGEKRFKREEGDDWMSCDAFLLQVGRAGERVLV